MTLRTYDVGFGDCFLLTFVYPRQKRHVLIDFGSMRLPEGKRVDGKPIKGSYLKYIAKQIAADCEGQLDIIVATHRHQDHISGFARQGGRGPGEIIRQLKPRLVLQPWTEDPGGAEDATEPLRSLHVKTLAQMQGVAQMVRREARKIRGERLRSVAAELEAVGFDNIKNADAVANLATMAPNRYVHFGASAGTGRLLPGVRVSVLGPPTVAQTATILKQRSRDPDEFWHLAAAFWQRVARTDRGVGGAKSLFPGHPDGRLPRSAGWFKYVSARERAETLLSIVRALDNAMNNTSVILLFELPGLSLLFPGDAQYENWMYALSQSNVRKRLEAVGVYKVGHHGSLNATPKTLWEGFRHRGPKGRPERLVSVLSTREGVHGALERRTEVPRRSLMRALQASTSLQSTTAFSPDELGRAITLMATDTDRSARRDDRSALRDDGE